MRSPISTGIQVERVACGSAEALGELPLPRAKDGFEELFDVLPPLIHTFTTCERYALSRRLIEALV
jgi:hypothetical protein